MQEADFEEKEYETPLYQELLGHPSANLWTPGQVFEHHFGIDGAVQVNNPLFWSIVNYSAPPRGAILDDYKWGRVWRAMQRITNSANPIRRPLPDFQVNLLLQVKRPDYLKGTNSKLSQFGISSYWRFKIRRHQQEALEYVSDRLKNRALVLYGCAAFHTYHSLFLYIRSKSLITHSSFVRAEKLSGHSAWNFDSPGMVGVACSEVEYIEEPKLFDQIEEMIGTIKKVDLSEKEKTKKATENLEKLSHEVISAMKKLSNKKNPIAHEFIRRFEIGNEALGSNKLEPAVKAFSIIAGFFEFTGTSWLVAY